MGTSPQNRNADIAPPLCNVASIDTLGCRAGDQLNVIQHMHRHPATRSSCATLVCTSVGVLRAFTNPQSITVSDICWLSLSSNHHPLPNKLTMLIYKYGCVFLRGLQQSRGGHSLQTSLQTSVASSTGSLHTPWLVACSSQTLSDFAWVPADQTFAEHAFAEESTCRELAIQMKS